MNVLEHSSGRIFLIAGILVLFASVSLFSPSHTAVASSSTGVIVPLYAYPGSTWQGLIQAKEAYPSVPVIAVINPSNGPGSYQDPTILQGVRSLQAAGITVVGYIYTQYAARSLSLVESDIAAYRNLYGLSGVFFDEMSNVPGFEWYYSSLTSYVHSRGMYLSVGNPGTGVPASFVGTVDLLVIYENAGLPSISLIASRTDGYSKQHFSMTPYAVGYVSQSYISSASYYLSYMYITNGQYPNQYSVLPSYFSSFMSDLAGENGINPGGVALTVNSVSLDGSPINGIWTVTKSTGGLILASGFSPLTYSALSGGNYIVSASNYGNYVFSHWSTGATSNTITFSPTHSTTLTAYYNTTSGTVTVPMNSVSFRRSVISRLHTLIQSSGSATQSSSPSPSNNSNTSNADSSATSSVRPFSGPPFSGSGGSFSLDVVAVLVVVAVAVAGIVGFTRRKRENAIRALFS